MAKSLKQEELKLGFDNRFIFAYNSPRRGAVKAAPSAGGGI
jgi:hypothetical protein